MSRNWWKAAAIRALRTMAQTAAALIATGAVLADIDWIRTGSATVLAGVLSMLTSLGGLPEVEDEAFVEARGDGWPVDEEKQV